MDRCALFIDAGYLLSDGAMAVHGTRQAERVSWDFGGLLDRLGELAREHSGLPLLRCYWYGSAVEGRRGPEHEALADLPGLKLRLGRSRPGRGDGVETELNRDLMTLARNRAIADAVVVSGDEDLVGVLCDAQDLGVRVTVLHVSAEGAASFSRLLRQECDDVIAVGSGELRPYVSLLSGVDRAYDTGPSPLSNGHGTMGSSPLSVLQDTAHPSPPAATPLTPQPAPAAVPQLAAPAESSASAVLNGLFGSSAPEQSQPSYLPSSYGSPTSTGPSALPSPASSYGASPSAGNGDHTGPPSSSGYGSPSSPSGYVSPTSAGGYESPTSTGGYGSPTSTGGFGGSTSAGGYMSPTSTDADGFSSPTSTGSGGFGGSTSAGGYVSPTSTGGFGGSPSTGADGLSAPASPASGYGSPTSTGTDGFSSPTSTGSGGFGGRPSTDGYGAPAGNLPAYPLTPPPVQPPAQKPPTYGSYTGTNSLVPQSRAAQPAPSLSDAVQAAHTEGQDFGESVARDAPVLWLEAVLARKPRMPSDLEARLLQGSALPIDFLLHDEVRHALRRGFWDALERARR